MDARPDLSPIDRALESLEDLPVAEHVGVFEQAHSDLKAALDGQATISSATPSEPATQDADAPSA